MATNEETSQLYHILTRANEIASNTELDDLLDQMLDLIIEVCDGNAGTLYLLDSTHDELEFKVTRLPPLRALGRLHTEDPPKALDFAYRHGRVMATEILACGIDLSFAPVLDLDGESRVIGDRAFSDRPEVVEELGRAYLGGMHDAGMRTTGKHFPGHGSVAADSHVDDVIDGRSLEQIEQSDLLPLRRLARELDALMIAHVIYPAVDALPAGYSAVWLREILRGALAYRGVVFSDDLGMHAARAVGDLPARTRLCLDAGCDL